ncbi:hypothetical protein MAM1_0186c07518 [Mucor ambiguus]|uniref:Uncharacterized protein n=1 Tax=Mucor ambiguus TaxID=91626 RepID=A0A0C9MWR2_9FUNG|nr:hypothetical protein MAM1_0186c07518 [Mucor ambiguus]
MMTRGTILIVDVIDGYGQECITSGRGRTQVEQRENSAKVQGNILKIDVEDAEPSLRARNWMLDRVNPYSTSTDKDPVCHHPLDFEVNNHGKRGPVKYLPEMARSYWTRKAPVDIDLDLIVCHSVIETADDTHRKPITIQNGPKVRQINMAVGFFLVEEQPNVTIDSTSCILLAGECPIQFCVLVGNDRDNNKSVNITFNIATTNVSFENENESDAVDSKANNNATANAIEAKVINGHAEQEAIDQMM